MSMSSDRIRLATDDMGSDDCSCRVIYTEGMDYFGPSVRLQGGHDSCYGFSGSFERPSKTSISQCTAQSARCRRPRSRLRAATYFA